MKNAEHSRKVYDEINALLSKKNLLNQLVKQTPGWESAVREVQSFWENRGRFGPPMGPANNDTWSNWLHILSHTLEDGHTLDHAECELLLVKLVVSTL